MPPTAVTRKLTVDDILDLRAYEKVRAEKKAEVLEIKRRRRIELGTFVTVMLNDALPVAPIAACAVTVTGP